MTSSDGRLQHMLEGRVPERLLLGRSKILKEEMLKSASGISPVRELIRVN